MTLSDLVTAEKTRTQSQVCGRHILALQDTTELNFESHAGRTTGLGTVGNGSDAGVFLHPMLAVDAASGATLGFGHIHLWNRLERAPEDHWNYPIEEKESYRWLASAIQSKQTLSDASMITFVADRESDIYELYDRISEENVHLLNRVRSDRKLNCGGKLYTYLDSLAPAGDFTINLPREIRQKRLARNARLSVRYGEVDIVKPKKCRDKHAAKCRTLRVVEVIEASCPAGVEPIHWRLLTTHTITNFEEALQVIRWYQKRWLIEQLFRTLKSQGLDIESTQVERAESLIKLSIIALCAALKIMQLVQARDGQTEQTVDAVFNQEERKVLTAVLKDVEGKTEKQKNPFPTNNLAWAAWIIARLGGWKGYKSEAAPGPITMARGLERFKAFADAWILFKDLCIG